MKNKLRGSRGVALLELLIAAAILLTAAGAGLYLVRDHRNGKAQDLSDAAAQALFSSAQSRMTQLRQSGLLTELDSVSDPEPQPASDREEGETLGVITSDDPDRAEILFPLGSVDEDLYSQSWVIEYDPREGSVRAVFVSTDPSVSAPEVYRSADPSALSRYRTADKSRRSAFRGTLGYCAQAASAQSCALLARFRNAGTLTLWIELYSTSGDAVPTVTILGQSSGRQSTITLPEPERRGSALVWTLTLDDPDTCSFCDLCPELTPGEEITATVTLGQTTVSTRPVNSLFGRGTEGDLLCVSEIRHLRNLDASFGLTDGSYRALQTSDLDLCGHEPVSPITNPALTSYDGAGYVISDLTIASETDAGLFGTFSGTALTNITLLDPTVTGCGCVGTLAGRLTADALISGCVVRMDPCAEDADLPEFSSLTTLTRNTDPDGATGGLVGLAEGALTVSDCTTALILRGGAYVGGLVGSAGALTAQRNIADCNISGSVIGGLAGSCDADSAVFGCIGAVIVTEDAPTRIAAGLAPCVVASAAASAAVLSAGDCAVVYPLVQGAAESTGLLYSCDAAGDLPLPEGAQVLAAGDPDSACRLLNAAAGTELFEVPDPEASHPWGYGTAGTWPYPLLASRSQYGDWIESPAVSAALTYYEFYTDGSYGLYTPKGEDSLSDTGIVVREGYGLLLPKGASAGDYTITLDDKPLTLTQTVMERSDGSTLIALPTDPLSTAVHILTVSSSQDPAGSDRWLLEPSAAASQRRVGALETEPAVESPIRIRTPGQLYALASGGDLSADYCLELDLDYTLYDASAFGTQTLTTQPPIGTDTQPFTGTFEGGCHTISGISFVGAGSVGLFGRNEGTVRNVFLLSQTPVTVSLSSSARGIGAAAALGTLAGTNAGTIQNCAAAGWSISAEVLRGAELFVGGLVGVNTGTVTGSTASAPSLTVDCLSGASALVGGLLGQNTGSVTDCLAAASVRASGSGAAAAGFAADNLHGTIQNSLSLCAVSGAAAVSFADGGTVRSCRFLSGGIYALSAEPCSFDLPADGAASPVSYEELPELSLIGFGIDDAFPTPTRDAAGEWITIGDRPVPMALGDSGVFYWEEQTLPDDSTQLYLSLSTSAGETLSNLTESFTDGSTVTRSGYGYYSLDIAPLTSVIGFPAQQDASAAAGVSEALLDLAGSSASHYHPIAFDASSFDAGTVSVTLSNGSEEHTWSIDSSLADAIAPQGETPIGCVRRGSQLSAATALTPVADGLYLVGAAADLDLLSQEQYSASFRLCAFYGGHSVALTEEDLSFTYRSEGQWSATPSCCYARFDNGTLTVRGMTNGACTLCVTWTAPDGGTCRALLEVTVSSPLYAAAYARSADTLYAGESRVWQLTAWDRSAVTLEDLTDEMWTISEATQTDDYSLTIVTERSTGAVILTGTFRSAGTYCFHITASHVPTTSIYQTASAAPVTLTVTVSEKPSAAGGASTGSNSSAGAAPVTEVPIPQTLCVTLLGASDPFLTGSVRAGESAVSWSVGLSDLDLPQYADHPDWALLGWYTQVTGGSLLVRPDGTLCAGVSGLTDNSGAWIGEEDVTLYPRWYGAETRYALLTREEGLTINGRYILCTASDPDELGLTGAAVLRASGDELSTRTGILLDDTTWTDSDGAPLTVIATDEFWLPGCVWTARPATLRDRDPVVTGVRLTVTHTDRSGKEVIRYLAVTAVQNAGGKTEYLPTLTQDPDALDPNSDLPASLWHYASDDRLLSNLSLPDFFLLRDKKTGEFSLAETETPLYIYAETTAYRTACYGD